MVPVLVLGGIVSALQSTLVVPLLPEFPGLLDVSSDDAAWLVTITLISAAVSMPIMGRMADMYGRRRILLVSIGALVAGSLVCAVAPGFPMMMIGRGLQGCGAPLVAIGISILRDTLRPRQMAHAMALMSASIGIGSALGPPVAGLLAHGLGWRGVFWSSTGCGILLFVCVLAFVPASPLRARGRFDIGGAVLLSIALVCVMLPITKGAAWGWTSLVVVALAVAGVVLLGGWAWFELRLVEPMVDLRAAAQRTVAMVHLAGLFVGIATLMNSLVTTQLLQLPHIGHGQGLSILDTGIAMIFPGTVLVLASPLAGMMLNRWGGRTSLLVGSGVLAAAYLARIPLSGSVVQVVVSSCIVSVGLSIVFTALPSLILGSVPANQTAAANSLNALVRTVGSAVASTSVAVVLGASERLGTVAGGPDARTLGWVLLFAAAAALAAMVSAALIPSRRRAARVGKDPIVATLC
ncbi:MFS transporter [Nocardioides sp. AE5]|uniref:MFS transporter n=1 Tax=Nocardioides sp. AE5 TaxID=2962573 RepID=UPI002882789C|nr:MFS transporter [Nocardioides sp. AE5]MDT0200915.1 MFS transporter [Nocardioides sp. AE5]